jgi:hypothetical protein
VLVSNEKGFFAKKKKKRYRTRTRIYAIPFFILFFYFFYFPFLRFHVSLSEHVRFCKFKNVGIFQGDTKVYNGFGFNQSKCVQIFILKKFCLSHLSANQNNPFPIVRSVICVSFSFFFFGHKPI